MKKAVILGAGMAGSMMANRLRHRLPGDWSITIIDRDNTHIYQPGLLFVPFGTYRAEEVQRPRTEFLPEGVTFQLGEVDRVDPKAKNVTLQDGAVLAYDLLLVATGCQINPSETEGMVGPQWQKSIFDFYTLEGAVGLRDALDRFEGGRLVLNIAEMPIKCPVAPLEFMFLADHYFHQRGIRDKVELIFSTPLDGAFTKPRAAAALGTLLEQKNITVEANFNIAKVDNDAKAIEGYDGRVLPFDIFVTVPLHSGSEWIARSGMGDDLGFLPTNKHTLQVEQYDGVFALGDTTNVPASKAGSVAHFQGDVLIENILRSLDGLAPLPEFDGHTNCYIETGFGKAILIDFNYETEPLPGRFPLPGIGPFSLLRESAMNHWGKLGFKWMYWNLLLKGKDLPLDHRMLMEGKNP